MLAGGIINGSWSSRIRFEDLDLPKTDSWGPPVLDSPLTDTMAFFTETFTLKTLADAWTDRKKELRILRRESAKDELLDRIQSNCIANRAQIHLELVDAALNAHSRSQLRVPLWSYRAVTFHEWTNQYAAELQEAREFRVDDLVTVDGHSERVHTLFRYTDLKTRLAAFFGPSFRIRVLKEPLDPRSRIWSAIWEAHTYTVILEYFPEMPTVTPPPASPLSEPPPLTRRSVGSIHDYDDRRDAARDLLASCYCHDSE